MSRPRPSPGALSRDIADRVFPWKTNPIKFAELAEEIRRAIILHKYAGSHPSTIDEIMQHCAVTDFLETWGAHCGAPRKVFVGHVRAMLLKLASEEPNLVELFARSRERQAGKIKVDPIKFLRELREED